MRINPIAFINAYQKNFIPSNRNVRTYEERNRTDVLIELGAHRDDTMVLTIKYDRLKNRSLWFLLQRSGWVYTQEVTVFHPGNHNLKSVTLGTQTYGPSRHINFYSEDFFAIDFPNYEIADRDWVNKDEIEHLVTRFILEYSID